MKIKFELAENVVMTNKGLMKRCICCDLLLPLKDFPFEKMATYQRTQTCKFCSNSIKKAQA